MNPSIVMVYAAWPDKRTLDFLGRLLRDLRSEVRAAAAMAVRRAVLSASAVGDVALPARVSQWILSGRLPGDSTLELLKLIGEAGWSGLEEAIARAAVSGRPHGVAAAEVRSRLSRRAQPDHWSGLWLSTGGDVLTPQGPDVTDWRVVEAGVVTGPDGAERLEPGCRATIGGRAARWVVVPRPGGEEARDALQVDGSSFWRVQEDDYRTAIGPIMPKLTAPGAASLAGLVKVDGPVSKRLKASLSLHGGDAMGARLILESLGAVKRPSTEVYLLLGRARAATGDPAGAREALVTYLEKAAKRAAGRASAEALLATLD